MTMNQRLAKELGVAAAQVDATVRLIDEGNTIPFIARYRKEVTGGLSDDILRDLSDRLTYLRALENRQEEVRRLISEQEKMTPDIEKAISAAQSLQALEDIYRPFRPKRRTRGMIARERGLEPLAAILLLQNPGTEPLKAAADFTDAEKGVETAEDALAGARDILAEDLSDDAGVRGQLREMIWKQGTLVSNARTREDTVYRMYYDYREPVFRAAPHRVLAINRGEKEEVLSVKVEAPEEGVLSVLRGSLLRGRTSPCAEQLRMAADDAWSRLTGPSMEREIRAALTEQAEEQAMKVFSENLRNLLMQPPVRERVVMGVDPAYRTGCKIAVVDGTGKVLATTVIYPTPPQNKVAEAEKVLAGLIETHGVTLLSIGNGTASAETEQFVADLIRKIDKPLQYMVVSEAGASVYSASKLAAEEFPEFDVSLRSAVSIARRLQDPLAELVKIDPKAIGVGQYQHDMNPKRLSEVLGGVVEASVNKVGVDLNTASPSLLGYVAGINATLARNIVVYREKNGRFRSRRELLKVARLGDKAFEQCAGFLRIPGAADILDNTAVHPESYEAAQALLKRLGYKSDDVRAGRISDLPGKIQLVGPEKLAGELGVGVPTLTDIVGELIRPGRDPRDEMPKPMLRSDVMHMEDLKEGMMLTGTVRNVADFGAFVDIGVHQDGLVHISELADRFVRKAMEVVAVGDIVQVRVLEVDVKRKRISLSMKGLNK